MFNKATLLSFTLLATAYAQQVGTLTAETHPTLNIEQCAADGTCTTEARSIVLDANWRWTHSTSGSTNCYTGNTWDETLCPDPDTCAANCAVDGADYAGTYGITTDDASLTIDFVTGANVGSRVYLLEDDETYKMFNLKNAEFTFDVDMSNLPCGLNGALYFVQMDSDGGKSEYTGNAAGAGYGTGYCDAQCPQDIKFINGAANVNNWTASATDINSGTGTYGSCCTEMDIWEANINAAAYTPHVCSVDGQTQCSGTDCGAGDDRYDGVCDKDGCDFNSYRMGDTTFLGEGATIDTSSTVTVITQFITSDNTTTGDLVEIRRLYVQDGILYQNSFSTFDTLTDYNSVTDDFCDAQKTLFGDTNTFETSGGLAKMGSSFDSGMVLVMSLWDDYAANMLWLDSDYPVDGDASTPGVSRGSCATSSGVPADVEGSSGSSSVTFSNIKYGPIGSTYSGASSAVVSSSTATKAASASSTSAAVVATSSAAAGTSSAAAAVSSSAASVATSAVVAVVQTSSAAVATSAVVSSAAIAPSSAASSAAAVTSAASVVGSTSSASSAALTATKAKKTCYVSA